MPSSRLSICRCSSAAASAPWRPLAGWLGRGVAPRHRSAPPRCATRIWCAHACRDFPGRIAVGIDARDGRVAVAGLGRTVGYRRRSISRGASRMPALPPSSSPTSAATASWPDPNIEATVALARAVDIPGDRLRRRLVDGGSAGGQGGRRRHHRRRHLRPGALRRPHRRRRGGRRCWRPEAGRPADEPDAEGTHHPLPRRRGRSRGEGRALRRSGRCRRPGGAGPRLRRRGRRRAVLPRHHRQPREPRHHPRRRRAAPPSDASCR